MRENRNVQPGLCRGLLAGLLFCIKASIVFGQGSAFVLGDLRYELINTIGESDESEIFFSNIVAVETDDQDNIYVLDRTPYTLWKIGANGIVHWKIEENGKGPGELQQARSVHYRDKKIYVGNQFGRRIDVFTADGALVRTISQETMGIDQFNVAGFVDDSTLVLTSPRKTPIGIIFNFLSIINDTITVSSSRSFFDTTSDQLEGFSVMYPTSASIGSIAIQHIHAGETAVLNRSMDIVGTYYENGTRYLPPQIQITSRGPVPHIPTLTHAPVDIDGQFWLTEVAWVDGYSDADDYLEAVTSQNDPKLKWNSIAVLIDRSGTPIASYSPFDKPVDHAHKMFYAGKNGLLVTQPSPDFPYLNVYRRRK